MLISCKHKPFYHFLSDKDQDTQTAINALIQELIDLSEYQPISSTHRKEEVSENSSLE